MDFDPDAYLKAIGVRQSGEFDPDSYLKSLSLQRGLARNKAKLAALQAEPDPMSLGEIVPAVGSEIWNRVKGIGRGLGTLEQSLEHPIATATNPAKRRELLRGVDDVVTLGYGRKLAGKIDEALPAKLRLDLPPEERARAGWDELSPTPSRLTSTEAEDASVAPGYRTGGNLVGFVLPGAGRSIGSAGGKLAQKLLPGAGALRGAGRAVATYEAAAPTMAGLSADAEGNRMGTALDVATDLPNIALSGGAGAVGGAISKRVSSSRGAQARRYIEEHGQGARVTTTNPGKGGVFEGDLAGVQPNDRGIGEAARIGAKKVLKGLKAEYAAETSEPYKVMKAQIDGSPAAAQPRDITPIVQNIKDAVWDLETAPAVRSQLQGTLDILERYRQGGEEGPIVVPESQLNGLRRNLMRAAKIGQSDVAGEREAPLRAAAFEAKRMVDEGPYAALNQFYSEGAQKLASSRKQLGLKAKPSANAEVDARKLKLTLEREGQNTKTAGGDADIEAFRAANPALDDATRLAELARARADLSYRLMPQHGGLTERLTGAMAGGGAAAVAGAAAAAASGHGLAAAVPFALGAAYQNASPIAGRLLYPLTQKATGAVAADPLMAAYEKWRERDRKRAEVVRTLGGRRP